MERINGPCQLNIAFRLISDWTSSEARAVTRVSHSWSDRRARQSRNRRLVRISGMSRPRQRAS